MFENHQRISAQDFFSSEKTSVRISAYHPISELYLDRKVKADSAHASPKTFTRGKASLTLGELLHEAERVNGELLKSGPDFRIRPSSAPTPGRSLRNSFHSSFSRKSIANLAASSSSANAPKENFPAEDLQSLILSGSKSRPASPFSGDQIKIRCSADQNLECPIQADTQTLVSIGGVDRNEVCQADLVKCLCLD
mmetsp:Transcript_50883/g.84421  ORF Transcript_50883/g.84421 Transcript_50883/m.84421 type:complete len:195 (+) Transcript_50883:111-695(+)